MHFLAPLDEMTEMTDFPILSYTSTCKISTLSYAWSLKRVLFSGGASPYRPLLGVAGGGGGGGGGGAAPYRPLLGVPPPPPPPPREEALSFVSRF